MSANENAGNLKTPPAQQQKQDSHGRESEMTPAPVVIRETYKGAGKLLGRTAIVTGGDSGIGRSVAAHYAREGADVAIVYLKGHEDAEETKKMVEAEGRACLLLSGDIGDEAFARESVRRTLEKFGKIDIVVNNAAEQHPQQSIEDITAEQLERTFRTNIFSMFYLTKAALPHLAEGASVINTTSVNAYRGNKELLDYSSTKGAIVSFTRSLSMSLAEKKIRVNGVAPGPIWTPLIPSTYPAEDVKSFGGSQPLGRVGQPADLGPAYVYLASADSSYVSGQIIHVNGGEVIGG
ncbi:SDR family oxidoreductase [Saccharibacillus alkalitolerans]|uniref:SDR family oxidoreductase n=1 Tax=Saccharibacillus alkalitolerans TaxID=2705290 RepID=A0ABX0F7A5_9BACL|nr:SDR family oxidoreductase [Saccharibacillus alkalitolerans]NGZ75810.1 SDR family oxidoreductase [Saccharibacillus alkalitolerans]